MVKCWASVLGDCSTVQSREHYLSRALWLGEGITVKGFDWLDGETRTVGIDSLVAKVLCEKHNTLLSPLDAQAAKAFHTISDVLLLNEERGTKKLSKGYWTVKEYHVDGNLFERWASKFLVGLFCVVGKDSFWHETETEAINPPLRVVHGIYGVEPFVEPTGLYLALTEGDKITHVDGVTVAPLFSRDGGLLGAHFEFKGFRLIIWLSDESVDSFNMVFSGVEFGPNRNQLKYRPVSWQFSTRKVITQRLIFSW